MCLLTKHVAGTGTRKRGNADGQRALLTFSEGILFEGIQLKQLLAAYLLQELALLLQLLGGAHLGLVLLAQHDEVTLQCHILIS